ncbi:hypothetical protein D3C80_2087070 [compost metagenome]
MSRPSTRFWNALLSFFGRARSMAIAMKVSVRPSSVVHTRSSQPEQYRWETVPPSSRASMVSTSSPRPDA